MNTPSPLVPQGTMPARGKTSFFVKVLMILALHVVVIGGMLLQGCRDTSGNNNNPSSSGNDTTGSASSDTLPPVTPASVSNNLPNNQAPAAPAQPGPATGAPAIAQQPPVAPTQPPPVAPVVAPPLAPPNVMPMAPTEGKEYVIAAGDTLGAIAHRNGISLKALLEANPGVNPKKLQIGQKIQVPGSTAAVASAAAPGAAPDMASGDTAVYTVKSGDTLSKIAHLNHTTYKKIMALNDLKSTSIKVGQKLKLPGAAAAAAPVVPAAAPIVPLAPAAPATTTAAAVPPVGNTASN